MPKTPNEVYVAGRKMDPEHSAINIATGIGTDIYTIKMKVRHSPHENYQ